MSGPPPCCPVHEHMCIVICDVYCACVSEQIKRDEMRYVDLC